MQLLNRFTLMVSSKDKREQFVFLSLGSNLGNRKRVLNLSKASIRCNIGDIVLESSLYKTAAWGNKKLNWFYNQVIGVSTSLDPNKVLQQCLEIETLLGRERSNSTHYENRAIDIDVLLFGPQVVHSNSLNLPHPKLHLRNFVLFPLAEIAPEIMHPVLGLSINQLKKKCADQNKIEKIE